MGSDERGVEGGGKRVGKVGKVGKWAERCQARPESKEAERIEGPA